MPNEGDWIVETLPNGGTIGHEYHAPVVRSLDDAKAEALLRIKGEAAQRLAAFNEEIEHADDLDLINGNGQTRQLRKAVAQSREDIRTARVHAESDVMLVATIDEADDFTW